MKMLSLYDAVKAVAMLLDDPNSTGMVLSSDVINNLVCAPSVKEIEPSQKWISVKDRLPEIRHVVLAFSPHHGNIWALSLHEDGFWYYWMDASRKYDPLWMGPITHWMPLPEPPKENNDAEQ